MSDILKQIDQLVADKTFSLDALDGIKAIRDALIISERKVAQLQAEVDEYIATINDRSDMINKLQASIDRNSEKMAAMEATVAAGQEAIYNAKKHEAVAGAWREAMLTVFKPNNVREHITRSVPIAQQNGAYVNNYNESSTVTREEG